MATMSPTIGELAKAICKAQGTLQAAKRVSENPFLHSKYADLGAIWEVARKPLSDNGLSVIQTTAIDEDGMVLETMLLHTSGEYITCRLPLMLVKANDPQSIGSAITYARRYTLAAIVGVATEDDDAEAATVRQGEAKLQESEKPKAEHWCPIHQVAFKEFKKGDNRWWSHKDGDRWCNEAQVSKAAQDGAQDLPVVGNSQEPQVQMITYATDPITIKSINDLFTACFRDFNKMQPTQVLKELGIKSSRQEDMTITPAEAYRTIAVIMAGQK